MGKWAPRIFVIGVTMALCIGPVPRLLNARDSFLNAIGLFIIVSAFLYFAVIAFEDFRKWYFKKDKEGGDKQ